MPGFRRLLAVLVLGLALVALTAAPAGADTASPTCSSFTVLKPGNEFRPADTTDPVESRAFGAAAILIRGTKLFYSVAILNPARETFVAGHIHIGAAGSNGPVVVGLFAGPPANPRIFTQLASVDIDQATADAICGHLAGYYVNYHTTQDPMGAVRGQLG